MFSFFFQLNSRPSRRAAAIVSSRLPRGCTVSIKQRFGGLRRIKRRERMSPQTFFLFFFLLKQKEKKKRRRRAEPLSVFLVIKVDDTAPSWERARRRGAASNSNRRGRIKKQERKRRRPEVPVFLEGGPLSGGGPLGPNGANGESDAVRQIPGPSFGRGVLGCVAKGKTNLSMLAPAKGWFHVVRLSR